MINFLAFISTGLILASEPEPVFSERIEVRVGSEIITTFDLQSHMTALQGSGQADKDKLVSTARDDLINAALVRETLRRAEIDISDQEVDRRINRIRVSEGIPSMEDFRRTLELQGLSLNQLRQQIRRQMEVEQFNQIVQNQVLQTIGEPEMMSFYRENQEEFSAHYQLNVQECLIPYAGNERLAKQTAQTYVQNPGRFSECVERHSQSPTRAHGGMINNVRKGMLMPQIEEVMFSTPEGRVGELQLPGAIRLFKVVNKTNLGEREFEDVRSEIENRIRTDRMNRARERYLERMRSETVIRVEAAAES